MLSLRLASPLAFALFFLTGLGAAHAAPLLRVSQMRNEHWDADGQLRGVTTVAQTQDGYLWVGTDGGLYRYDGVRYTLFDTKSPSAQLPSGWVRKLLAAKEGALYIGTDAGLAVRRGAEITEAQGLHGLIVQALFEDAASTIWVGTFDGLYRSTKADAGRFVKVPALGELSISSFAEPTPGALLVGTAGAGLKELIGDRVARSWDAPTGSPHWAVQCIGQLDANTWIVSADAQLFTLHDGAVLPYTKEPQPHEICDAMLREPDGTLWWLGSRAGVFRWNGEQTIVDAEPWTQSLPFTLLRDHDGDVWIGTSSDGMHRLHHGGILPIGKSEGLPADQIASVVASTDGGLWVGFDGAGAAHLARSRASTVPSVSRLVRDSAPVKEGILAMAETADGTTWFGTENGVFCRKPDGSLGPRLIAGHQVTVLLPVGDMVYAGTGVGLFEISHGQARARTEVRPVKVSALARTKRGALWVAASHIGLYEITSAGVRQWGRSDGLRSDRIYSLWAEGDDIWVGAYGTGGEGLSRVHEGTFHWYGPESGVPQADLSSLVGDGRGGLWGCTGEGLIRMSLAELGEAAARPGQQVHPRHYGERDGMRTSACSPDANGAARSTDGHLFFATTQGLVEVDPSLEPAIPPAPRVRIEELVLDGKARSGAPSIDVAVAIHRLDVRFTAPLYAAPERLRFRYRLHGIDGDWQEAGTDRIATYTDLPPGEFRFTVEAIVDGVPSQITDGLVLRIPARYYQTGWFRALVVLALALLVLAVFRLRVRSLEQQRTALTVLVVARTEDLRLKNDALSTALHSLKEAQEERLRTERLASVAVLVRGIAHELSNPLGVIAGNMDPLRKYASFLSEAATRLAAKFSGPADELERLTRLSPKRDLRYVKEDLDRVAADVADSARRAQLIVGDLQRIDSGGSRPVERVDVEAAVQGALRIFQRRLPEGAELTAVTSPKLGLSARAGELEQLVINLIDNALRAIRAHGKVEVSAREIAGGVELAVRDDGVGMSEEVRARATQAFYTTRAPGEGTGLGLAVVSAIVGHHAGTIVIESAPGAGTTIRVTLLDIAAP